LDGHFAYPGNSAFGFITRLSIYPLILLVIQVDISFR
jgi:hypothetical protein